VDRAKIWYVIKAVLGVSHRLLTYSRHDQEEPVSENLKNILLVMSNGGYLSPPGQNASNKELWVETWNRLDRFLPHLFRELFPEEANVPSKTGRASGAGRQTRPQTDSSASASKQESGHPPHT
jgi:golgi-specific brefeldin A-resistance guanine nucleotide exchange factor 1